MPVNLFALTADYLVSLFGIWSRERNVKIAEECGQPKDGTDDG